MSKAPSLTQLQLDRLINLWMDAYTDALPTIAFDEQWPSECYIDPNVAPNELTQWKPIKQQTSSDMFVRLSEALEEDIHSSIIDFYTRYWSDPLSMAAPAGDLVLLQVWNEADIERLRSNLIGHAMAKRQQKQPLSFFFACTEPDDGMLTVKNDDGSIWLEYPGKKPVKCIAESLPELLETLTLR